MSSHVQPAAEVQNQPKRGVRGWLAVWCIGAIAFHLFGFLGNFRLEGASRQLVAVSVFATALSAFGIFAAVSVFLVKPYALQLVFLNFLQWGAVLVLTFPLSFLTLSAGATLDWKPLAGFVVLLGVPWIIWFRYFKVSKRVLATFGRNM